MELNDYITLDDVSASYPQERQLEEKGKEAIERSHEIKQPVLWSP